MSTEQEQHHASQKPVIPEGEYSTFLEDAEVLRQDLQKLSKMENDVKRMLGEARAVLRDLEEDEDSLDVTPEDTRQHIARLTDLLGELETRSEKRADDIARAQRLYRRYRQILKEHPSDTIH